MSSSSSDVLSARTDRSKPSAFSSPSLRKLFPASASLQLAAGGSRPATPQPSDGGGEGPVLGPPPPQLKVHLLSSLPRGAGLLPRPIQPPPPDAPAHQLLPCSFISDLQIRTLAGGQPEPARAARMPPLTPFWAAAVSLDISGLSSAAERVISRTAMASPAAAEAHGARLLGHALDAFFSRLFAAARAHGGDPVHLFGDSLLFLVYSEDAAGLEDAARAAVRIALAALDYEAFEAPPPPARSAAVVASLQLQLHAAVAAGRLFAVRLGGDSDGGSDQLALVGTPLSRLARAAGLTGARNICLAPEVAQVASCGSLPLLSMSGDKYALYGPEAGRGNEKEDELTAAAAAAVDEEGKSKPVSIRSLMRGAGRLLASFRRSGSPVGPAAAEDPLEEIGHPKAIALPRGSCPETFETLGRLLPRDLLACLEAGLCPQPEFRSVVCSCVRVDGFALQEAPADGSARDVDFLAEKLPWLQRCARLVCAVVEGLGGVVRGCYHGGTGLCFFLTWGAAGVQCGDDAFRACSAALRIRDGFEDDGLGPVSVGCASGPVFTGVVGDPERRSEFACLGRAASVAARLMMAAAGTVCVDGPTCAALDERLVTEAATFPSEDGRLRAAATCYRVLGRARPQTSGRRPSAAPRARSRQRSIAITAPSEDKGGGALATLDPDALEGAGEGPEGGEAGGEGDAQAPAPPPPATREQIAETLRVAAASPECLAYGQGPAVAAVVELLLAARCPPAAGEADAAEGRRAGRALLLEGPRGSGKSTLVMEAERLAELVGLPVVDVVHNPKEMYPYEAVRLVLRSLVLPHSRPEAAPEQADTGTPAAEGAPLPPPSGRSTSNSHAAARAAATGGWVSRLQQFQLDLTPYAYSPRSDGTPRAWGDLSAGPVSLPPNPAAAKELALASSVVAGGGEQSELESPRSASGSLDGTSRNSGERERETPRPSFALLERAPLSGGGGPGGAGSAVASGWSSPLMPRPNGWRPPARGVAGMATLTHAVDGLAAAPPAHSPPGESESGPSSTLPRSDSPSESARTRRTVMAAAAQLGDGKLYGEALSFLRRLDPGLATPANGHTLARLLSDGLYFPSPATAHSYAGPPRSRRQSSGAGSSPVGPARSRTWSSSSSDPRAAAGALIDWHMDASSEGYRVFSFVCCLLEAVARRLGALFVVDDLCDLDSASQKCLAFLAQTGRACVLCTSRRVPPNTVTTEFSQLRRSRQTRVVELRPFSTPEEVAGFVSRVLGVEQANLSPLVAQRLAEKGEGSPLYLSEMARHLVACGLIIKDNGRAIASVDMLEEGEGATPPASGSPRAPPLVWSRVLPVPESLLPAAVVSQLDRLPTQAATVLKLVAVLGPRFETGLAQYALEGAVEWAAVADCLKILERSGLLVCVQAPDTTFEYLFVHPAHVAVLRGTIGAVDAAVVAWRAASYLTRTAAGRPRAAAATVAGYFADAGCHAQAEPYWDLAAEVAVEEGRYAEALEIGGRPRHRPASSTPAPTPGCRPGCRTPDAGAVADARRAGLQARALYGLGRLDEAMQAARECLRLLEAPLEGAAPHPLAVLLAAARCRRATRAPRRGRPASLEDAVARLADAPLATQRADVRAAAAAVYAPLLTHAGDAPAAAHFALAAVRGRLEAAGAEAGPLAEALALAAGTLHRACHGVGRAATDEMLAAAGRVAEALPLGDLSGAYAVERMAACVLDARFEEADTLSRQLFGRLRATGQSRCLGEALAHAAAGQALRGNFQLARARYAELRTLAQSYGNALHECWAYAGLATASLLEGSLPAGLRPKAAEKAPPEEQPLALLEKAYGCCRLEAADFPLEALALAAASAACALADRKPEFAEDEALEAVEALRRHRPAPRLLRPAARLPPLPAALLPLLLLAGVLADLLEGGYTEQAAALAARRAESRRHLAHGGPLLASFADQNRTPQRDYGESEATWLAFLRRAFADVMGALGAAAARHAAAAPAHAFYEGRRHELKGSPERAAAAYRRAEALARAAGMRPLAAKAVARLQALGAWAGSPLAPSSVQSLGTASFSA